jgi:RNA polymerase sigma factor (sigma-70 family)
MNGFLRFFQTIGKFEYRNEGSLVAWLKKIMVNECLMELRKQHSFLQVADEPVDMVDDPEVFDRMNAADIYRLILQLPVGYRTVFNLFSVENFSHAEIAKMLAISEGTSKSQFHKARKLLQQMVTTQNEYYAVQENK